MDEWIESSIREHNVGNDLILTAIDKVQFGDGTMKCLMIVAFAQNVLTELHLIVFGDAIFGEDSEHKIGCNLQATNLGASQIGQQAFWNSKNCIQLSLTLTLATKLHYVALIRDRFDWPNRCFAKRKWSIGSQCWRIQGCHHKRIRSNGSTSWGCQCRKP